MTSSDRLRRVGLLLLGSLVLLALGADWLAPYDPAVQSGRPFESPSAGHWLGTNDIGQDIASELLHATRVSLTIGVLAGLLAAMLGTTVGLTAGSCRSSLDGLLMRVVDLVLVIPFLPLIVLLAAYVGTSWWQVTTIIGLLMWARPARVIRAHTRALIVHDHILAARASGAGDLWILARHVMPAVLPIAVTQFVLVAGSAITVEAGLSFLGLGDPTQKSWGTMLFYAQARNALLTGQWLWWVVPPGAMIAATVTSLALVGLSHETSRR